MKSHELRLGPDERANADRKNTVLAKFCTNTESDLSFQWELEKQYLKIYKE